MKWNVWSVSDKERRGLVVDEGSRKRCEKSAEYRNAAAKRLSVDIRFEALPDGEQPEYQEPRGSAD